MFVGVYLYKYGEYWEAMFHVFVWAVLPTLYKSYFLKMDVTLVHSVSPSDDKHSI